MFRTIASVDDRLGPVDAPFTLGVGPSGSYATGLDAERQAQLRERCRELLSAAPFVLTARAWAARGLA